MDLGFSQVPANRALILNAEFTRHQLSDVGMAPLVVVVEYSRLEAVNQSMHVTPWCLVASGLSGRITLLGGGSCRAQP